MTSTPGDLVSRIEAAKAKVAEIQTERSQSRARTDSDRSKKSSDAPPTIPEESWPATNEDRGGVGASRMAGPEGAGGPPEPSQTAQELDSSSSEDDEEEPVEAPAPPPAPVKAAGPKLGPKPGPISNRDGKQPENPIQPPVRGSRTNQNQTPPERQTGPQRNGSPIEQNQAIVLASDLSADHKALVNELVEINGQDSYDALAAGIGKLKQSEYLLLPNGFTIPNVLPRDVGKPIAHRALNVQTWAAIYALNKARAPSDVDAKVFALLRLEAVKCGWLENQREISFAPAPADSMATLAADMADLRDRAPTIKTASFLLPLVAEHVFRTFGHHFISTDATNYAERYAATFRSCLVPEIASLLRAPVLYHTALHWVSPGRAWRVLQAQLETANLPDALKIRANAAPAGTAILTTTSAILQSMKSVNIDVLFKQYGGFDVDKLHNVTSLVKQDPPKYHKAYFAYNVPAPSAQELTDLEEAKQIGVAFAPFAQAYINTYMREAALGKAQALKKHAEQNPIQMRRAQNLFRALTRGNVESVQDLFVVRLGRRGAEQDDTILGNES